MRREEARCPHCRQWSEVEFVKPFGPNDIGGYWWKDSGACPKCGALILVESECEFKTVQEVSCG